MRVRLEKPKSRRKHGVMSRTLRSVPQQVDAAAEMSFSSKGVSWWLPPDENPAQTEEDDGQAIPRFYLLTVNVLQEQTR